LEEFLIEFWKIRASGYQETRRQDTRISGHQREKTEEIFKSDILML
jgi:hypothetical protein